MENKKVNVFFYLIVIFFLALILILIKDFNAKRASEYNDYTTIIAKIVKEKNNKIRVLYSLLIEKERENADLRNTLAETRNDLESLSRRLAPPTPVAIPASAPTPAAATK